MNVAKTNALISFAVTAKLICVFVFAYAKSRFSHDAAYFISNGCKSYQNIIEITEIMQEGESYDSVKLLYSIKT